jgi:hypothetical protein
MYWAMTSVPPMDHPSTTLPVISYVMRVLAALIWRFMMPNTIGYARVSTEDQTLATQQDALLGAGCVRVFAETGSGKSVKNRDQLQAALGYLNPADTLAVWRLDRLGRSVRDLIDW